MFDETKPITIKRPRKLSNFPCPQRLQKRFPLSF